MKFVHKFMMQPWFYVIIAAIGVTLKFYRIDYQYFWFDEMAAVEHTSGLSGFQTYDAIPKNEILPISYYHNLFHLNDRNLSIESQLHGLSKMTNLNPLLSALLVFWHRLAGDDTIHYRLFNVILLLMCLPFLFFVTRDLFKSDLSGWIAVSIFSVSPFFHYYAHEATYNTLMAFLLILNNFLFVKAINKGKYKWWIGYALSGILALYASLLSGLLIFGHMVYVLALNRKLWKVFGLSVLAVFLGYLPWLISIFNNYKEINNALAWHLIFDRNQNFLTLLLGQFSMMARTFVTLNYKWLYFIILHRPEGNYPDLAANLFILVVLTGSIVFALKKAPKKAFWLMVFMVLPQLLFFLISDLIRGAGSTYVHRYLVTGIIGMLFFLVFMLGHKISLGKPTYFAIYSVLVVLGLTSIFLMSKDRCWDIPSGMCQDNIEDARMFSGEEKTLLITGCYLPIGTGIGGFMAIMNECSSDSIDIMQVLPDVTDIKDKIPRDRYSGIYFAYADESLINNLKTQLGVQMDSLEIERYSPVWKINL